jgi:hypothetical protein
MCDHKAIKLTVWVTCGDIEPPWYRHFKTELTPSTTLRSLLSNIGSWPEYGGSPDLDSARVWLLLDDIKVYSRLCFLALSNDTSKYIGLPRLIGVGGGDILRRWIPDCSGVKMGLLVYVPRVPKSLFHSPTYDETTKCVMVNCNGHTVPISYIESMARVHLERLTTSCPISVHLDTTLLAFSPIGYTSTRRLPITVIENLSIIHAVCQHRSKSTGDSSVPSSGVPQVCDPIGELPPGYASPSDDSSDTSDASSDEV